MNPVWTGLETTECLAGNQLWCSVFRSWSAFTSRGTWSWSRSPSLLPASRRTSRWVWTESRGLFLLSRRSRHVRKRVSFMASGVRLSPEWRWNEDDPKLQQGLQGLSHAVVSASYDKQTSGRFSYVWYEDHNFFFSFFLSSGVWSTKITRLMLSTEMDEADSKQRPQCPCTLFVWKYFSCDVVFSTRRHRADKTTWSDCGPSDLLNCINL